MSVERVAHLYDATYAAGGAAGGRGEEGSRLDAKGRAHWREKALQWGKAHFAVERRRIAANADGAVLQLHWWLSEPDMASVREVEALKALPEAERAQWWALWGEVKLAAGPYREGLSQVKAEDWFDEEGPD